MTKEEYLNLKEGDKFVFNELATEEVMKQWSIPGVVSVVGTVTKAPFTLTHRIFWTVNHPIADEQPGEEWILWENQSGRKPWEIIDLKENKPCTFCGGTKQFVYFMHPQPCHVCCPDEQ